jgi:PilZ domain-containing protein
MNDRRRENRLLCADLVEVIWKDKSGRQRRRLANVEDISLSGMCLQMEQPILRETPITLHYDLGEMNGTICYCLYHDMGYFIGVQFEAGFQWSSRQFWPKHLFDPLQLVE